MIIRITLVDSLQILQQKLYLTKGFMHLKLMLLKHRPPWNILIWPADTDDGLVIHRSLRDAKEVILHGATHQLNGPASFFFSHLHQLPEMEDSNLLYNINDLIKTHDIHAVFPGGEASLNWLITYRKIVKAYVIAATYELLPALSKLEKPLETNVAKTGDIYTIDCFSQKGRLLSAQAHTTTQLVDLAETQNWASKITKQYALNGAWSFRVQSDGAGRLYLLDIIPRITTSMIISHAAGPNFPLLSLYDAAGYDVSVDVFSCMLRAQPFYETRFLYDQPIDALYVDLDGSLMLRGQVNTKLVALIFQCHNRNIPVNLLTRHPGDLNTMLNEHRLTGLFSKIIHITDISISKAAHIYEKNAVLIDDSFQERHDTYKQIGIRCFDPAAALCLINQRDGPIDD